MFHRSCLWAPAAILGLLACACSAPPPTTASASRAGEAATATASPATPAQGEQSPGPGATTGGDGSAIRLGALTPAEIAQADLSGELGCRFEAAADATLLAVAGFVASEESAQGIVKVAGSLERVAAPGGFDAAVDGGDYSGRGKVVRITLTGPALGGGESPPRPATLTYLRADGAQRTWTGRWTCGP